jgi:hypothetical protein
MGFFFGFLPSPFEDLRVTPKKIYAFRHAEAIAVFVDNEATPSIPLIRGRFA